MLKHLLLVRAKLYEIIFSFINIFCLTNACNLTDRFLNCRDISRAGNTESGIYNITLSGRAGKDQVYCDLETDGGGWLVNI